LLLYSSHLPLGVPNWPVIYFINSVASSSFLAPLPGNEEEEAPTSTTSSHVNYVPAPFHKPPYTYPYGRSVDKTMTILVHELGMAPFANGRRVRIHCCGGPLGLL
jgi:hypothetical protein